MSDDYSPREMRLMTERDTALTRAETAEARLAHLEAGTALTQAQTDILTKGMREATQLGRALAFEEGQWALDAHVKWMRENHGPIAMGWDSVKKLPDLRALAATVAPLLYVERAALEKIGRLAQTIPCDDTFSKPDAHPYCRKCAVVTALGEITHP